MMEPDRNSPQEFQQDSVPSPLPSLRTTSDTESMGDFHFSSENFSLALEYFEKAYQHTQVEGPQGDLWRLGFKIGDAYRRKGLFSEAREWFLLAQGRLKGQPDSVEHGLVLDRIGSVLMNTGTLEEALQSCFQGYERLKNSPLHAEVAENLNRIAIIYMRLGYPKEASEFFTDALVTFRRVDHHLGVVCATMNLGLIKKNACEFDGALALFRKSLELAKQHSFQKIRISLLLNSGIVYFKLNRDREASEMFIRARRLAREAGDEAKTVRATTSLARVQIRLGNFRRAEKLLLEGRVLAEKNRLLRSVALADEFLGELAETRGDLEAAMANYEVSMDLAREIAPKGDIVVELLNRMSRVKLSQGLPLDAIRLSERGLKLAENNGELFEIPYLFRTQARSWLRLENFEKAEIAFRNSLRAYEATHDECELAQTRLEFAACLADQPTLEKALRARKILEDLLHGNRDERADHFFFKASLLLARLESWLGDIDRALLAVFDAEGYLPDNASEEDVSDLDLVRGQVEQRKIGQGSGHFGFLPGQDQLNLARGGKEDLPENLRQAWHSLFELCDADAGCLCMDDADGTPFEFIEGKDRDEFETLRSTSSSSEEILANDNGHAHLMQDGGPTFLYQPLHHAGQEIGFLCLWRKDGRRGFSHEMVRYLAGFARMATLIAFSDRALSKRNLIVQSRELPEATRDIITRDPHMLELLHLAGKIAESPAWVLLSGETGTGKGILAYAIHRMSKRGDKRFIHVNCAALPEELLESELFGHVKGSFTGAIHDKTGLIEEASGGTLFLDEVGKTSLNMQAKLLQFLDTREIRRVGATDSRRVDVRLISATKTNLRELASKGVFLEDLYYRLNDFPLTVPPLRERKGDIGLLAEYFLDLYSKEFGKTIPGFSKAALGKLQEFGWRGNVRELEKVIKRALLLAVDGEALSCEQIMLGDDFQSETRGRSNGDLNLKRQVGELEKQLVLEALEQCSWNRSRACRSLGISYPTLLQKIRRYDLGH